MFLSLHGDRKGTRAASPPGTGKELGAGFAGAFVEQRSDRSRFRRPNAADAAA